ncbi:MAG: SDR family oxidoreductase [Streptosporangiales bacterium]|nr:SDR family oxidoreductase [Streptosporangiales bacterium]
MTGQAEEKVVVVTGAASGIGRATAVLFAGEGARVVAADLDGAGGEETVRIIGSSGGTARFAQCDVTKRGDTEKLVEQAVSWFGGLHHAFNSAGIEGKLAKTAAYSEEDWQAVIDVNLTGTWLAMRAELNHMASNGGGSVVNVASVAGLVGSHGMPAYTASKHGVVGLTKAAALEYASANVRVNAVCPGIVATPMVDRMTANRSDLRDRLVAQEPVGRPAEPEEIAQCVLWLCSDRASYVTGHAMAVDGGFVAR